AHFERLRSQVDDLLKDFHSRYPLRRGMAREEVRSRTGLSARVFDALVQSLAVSGQVRDHGSVLAMPNHEIALDQRQEELAAAFLDALKASPMSPPGPSTFNIDSELLGALAGQGRVVRVDDNIVFDAEFFRTLQADTISVIEDRGQIT